MARFAVGDIQGCYRELRELLALCGFRSDRDEVWFVGDLVNRGPASLEVLRFVRALGDNAVSVLGNHDLHLLAIAYGSTRQARPDDTFEEIFSAPDRGTLFEWLLARPLAHRDLDSGDLLIHAGLPPQWSATDAVRLANRVAHEMRNDPNGVFEEMYGNQPDRWEDSLMGAERRRFIINALTRMRFCTADGRIELKQKGAPDSVRTPWMPWFTVPQRESLDTRVIFGHWSTLGYYDQNNVLALDTGCVWGGALTAVRLDTLDDTGAVERWSIPSAGYRAPGSD